MIYVFQSKNTTPNWRPNQHVEYDNCDMAVTHKNNEVPKVPECERKARTFHNPNQLVADESFHWIVIRLLKCGQ